MKASCKVLVAAGVLLAVAVGSKGEAETTQREVGPTVAVGMPFAGKWAYNVTVQPPYTDQNSSHPSVHKIDGGGDWATDLYAEAGTEVRLHVKTSSGQLSYAWKYSTGCPDSTWILVRVNDVPVGTIYYSHLAKGATRTGPITDGMLLGVVADPAKDNYCNPGPHVHIELTNSVAGTHACWTDHGDPGVMLDEGAPLGLLGSSNDGRQQPCASSSPPAPTAHATQVVGGWDFTCALTDAGGVMCWGANEHGQLGDGSTRDRSHPGYVIGLKSGVAAISAGDYHVCARTRTGGVRCWGGGRGGQLGNGKVGNSTRPVDVVGLSRGVAAVSAGGEHSCALLVVGGTRCWGEAGNGQFARVVDPDIPQPVPLAAGFPSSIVELYAGDYHTCMRTRSGAALCVGNNGFSELGYGLRNFSTGVPMPVTGLGRGVRLLATHFTNSCAVVGANSVYCWGALGQQDPPRPLPVAGISGVIRTIAVGGSACAIIDNGKLECWTRLRRVVDVAGLGSGVTSVGLGLTHSCAIAHGDLKCWGTNAHGQLGDGTHTPHNRPVSVIGLSAS